MRRCGNTGEHPTQPNRPWPGDAIAALYRAIRGVQARCNELAAALDEGYPLEIEFAASDLAAAWFAAVSALKILHLRTANAQDQKDAAMLALRGSHQVLIVLFGRRMTTPAPATELPRLRDALCTLSEHIDRVMGAYGSNR